MKKKVGEHTIEIPDWEEGMDLINEGLSYEDSYWKVQDIPKILWDIQDYTVQFSNHPQSIYDSEGRLVALSKEDSIEVQKILKRELHRRLWGVHMKNGNDIIWIAPDYYFFLQWFQQADITADEKGNRLGGFRKIQNDAVQLWEHVKHNKEIAGAAYPKVKKCGWTYVFAAAMLNEATITRNNLFLMMSKDYETCKLTQFSFIGYGFEKLPWVMKPTVSNKNLSEVKFGKPKDKIHQSKYGKYLNNLIKACKTKPAAFDGPVPYRCWIDEFPKMWMASKCSLKKTFDKSLEAVKINQMINGKLLLTSYMQEEADEGFFDAKTILENSLLRTIEKGSKRTKSQLIVFPIYGHQSNAECFDKYGDCDEECATRKVNEELLTKKTRRDIITHKRQYPMSWSDMVDNVGAGSAFDNPRLAVERNKLHEQDLQGIHPYKEGHLRWENSMYEAKRPKGQFCNVYFEELTPERIKNGEVGSIRIFHDLERMPDFKHILNRPYREGIKRNGLYCPHESNIGVMSCDPVGYKMASEVKEGSLNASIGGFMYEPAFDTLAKTPISNVPLFDYLYRHEDPDIILEDMIKIIMYWGFYAIIEANKEWMETDIKKHGLQNFLIVRQVDKSITPWEDFADFRGGNKSMFSDENMIAAYMRSIQRYIAEPRDPEGVNYIEHIKSIRVIDNLMDFDPLNTKRFDSAVAFGYWRVGIENFMAWKVNQLNNRRSVPNNEDAKRVLDRILAG